MNSSDRIWPPLVSPFLSCLQPTPERLSPNRFSYSLGQPSTVTRWLAGRWRERLQSMTARSGDTFCGFVRRLVRGRKACCGHQCQQK